MLQFFPQSLRVIHQLEYMASSHLNVKKGTQSVLFMAGPCNTSDGAEYLFSFYCYDNILIFYLFSY